MTTDQTLQQAVERLYQVFAHYPLAKVVIGCGCCVSEADQVPIHSKPLRELTERDLYKYTFKALLTWGDEDDFRHFLPRIFELLTLAESLVYTDAELIFRKLPYGNWSAWPEIERAAIKNYLAVLWRTTLNIPISEVDQQQGFSEINAAIRAIAQAEDDLMPYFQEWIHTRTRSAFEQLNQFIASGGHSIVHSNSLYDAYWDRGEARFRQVIDWLKDAETVRQLENLFFENVNAPYADALASTIDNLNWLRTAHQ